MNIVTQSTSSSSKTSFTLFCPSQRHNNVSLRVPNKTTPTVSCSTKLQASTVIDQKPLSEEPQTNRKESAGSSEGTLKIRRPVLEGSREKEREPTSPASRTIDTGLEELVKQMGMFEPERVESSDTSKEKPLVVNLDLALFRVKQMKKKFRYEEAVQILKKCVRRWPEDGRIYVVLGKILCKQTKWDEARAVYELGCQATQGENPYIWQCWAVLEEKVGNIRRARELFDAATVADKRHPAAWHGWAVLEQKQGNVKKARQLLTKGLELCGPNEYIFQTLAILESKSKRIKQARYFFKQATKYNRTSAACWLAWAQLEVRQENNLTATKLFEKAVDASPKNRYAWHVWGLFEEKLGNIEKARKLLKIGHALNPRDPVFLQSLALLEYKYSTANVARILFRRASVLDPKHQAVWFAWGWMEWKEGNLPTARKLYQKVLEINAYSDSAARCMQAWGILEQRAGNLTLARRLFRSSLNLNSQSFVTWESWAHLEEDQGNATRAEEIRNLYFQQRTEVVEDDKSWVMGFLNVIDPAVDSVKKFLRLDQSPSQDPQAPSENNTSESSDNNGEEKLNAPPTPAPASVSDISAKSRSGLDLDSFIKARLNLDPSKLEYQLQNYDSPPPSKTRWIRRQSDQTASTL